MGLIGKYKDNHEFGLDFAKQKNPTYEERAILAFSFIEAIEGRKLDEKGTILILQEVCDHYGFDMQDILKILVHLLSDTDYFQKIMKKYKALFAKPEIKIPG